MSISDASTWPKESDVRELGAFKVGFKIDKAMELFKQEPKNIVKVADFTRGPWKSIESSFISAGYILPKQNRSRYDKANPDERTFDFEYNPEAAKNLRSVVPKQKKTTKIDQKRKRIDEESVGVNHSEPETKKSSAFPYVEDLLSNPVTATAMYNMLTALALAKNSLEAPYLYNNFQANLMGPQFPNPGFLSQQPASEFATHIYESCLSPTNSNFSLADELLTLSDDRYDSLLLR
jgi:hypothetical protein